MSSSILGTEVWERLHRLSLARILCLGPIYIAQLWFPNTNIPRYKEMIHKPLNILLHLLIYCIYVNICAWACMSARSMCLDQGQTEGVSSLPHLVEPGDWIQVVGLGGECFDLLSQCASSYIRQDLELASQCLMSSPQLPVVEQS